MKRITSIIMVLVIAVVITSCGSPAEKELIPVKFMLDWVPNTNHTGIFVADTNGYFEEAGLEVEIIRYDFSNRNLSFIPGPLQFGVALNGHNFLQHAPNFVCSFPCQAYGGYV